jgi:hypothetical protein
MSKPKLTWANIKKDKLFLLQAGIVIVVTGLYIVFR